MNTKELYEFYVRLLSDPMFFEWLLEPSKGLDDYWINFMQENPEKNEVVNQLKMIFKHMKIEEEGLTEEDRRRLWLKIEASIKVQSTKRRKLTFFFRYAAAFLLLVLCSAFFFMLSNKQTDPPIDYVHVISDMEKLITEKSNNIILVLNNKEKIEIENNQAQVLYDGEGEIQVNSVIVKEKQRVKDIGKSLNQLYVPYGKTTHIVMNDGTKMWINSGTKVVYPLSFTEDKREIFVDGEVYLEVMENKNVPFIVKTGLLDIQVLGTSFNVSAYGSDERQSVVLASGSVSVKDMKGNRMSTIHPNQKYTYEKSNNSFNLQEVNAQNYTEWRFGFLSLHKERLVNILKKIERFYDVQIDYTDTVGQSDNITVSGKLDLKEDIVETFRILSKTAPIDYSFRNNTIKVIVKP